MHIKEENVFKSSDEKLKVIQSLMSENAVRGSKYHSKLAITGISSSGLSKKKCLKKVVKDVCRLIN